MTRADNSTVAISACKHGQKRLPINNLDLFFSFVDECLSSLTNYLGDVSCELAAKQQIGLFHMERGDREVTSFGLEICRCLPYHGRATGLSVPRHLLHTH